MRRSQDAWLGWVASILWSKSTPLLACNWTSCAPWIGTTARFSIIDYRYSLGELDAGPTSRMHETSQITSGSHQKKWPGTLIMIICTFENLFSHASKGIQRLQRSHVQVQCSRATTHWSDWGDTPLSSIPKLVQDPRPLDAKSVSEQANGIESINLQTCIDCPNNVALLVGQCWMLSHGYAASSFWVAGRHRHRTGSKNDWPF